MRILNITNLRFNGIKVVNDKYISKPINAADEAKNAYRAMSDSFEYVSNAAQSIDVVTQSEQRSAINNEYFKKLESERDRIYSGYKGNPDPIRAIKMHNAQKRLEREKKEAQKSIKESDLMDLKRASVEELEKTFNNGVKRVQELDSCLEDSVALSNALVYNSENIQKKVKDHSGFSKIAGYEKEKSVLNNAFILRVLDERQGIDTDVAGSVLFFGPYNNGKTYITKNVAAEADCRIVPIKAVRKSNLMQKLIEQAQISQEHFNKTNQRTIIFLDELDRVLNSKSSETREFEEFIKNCSNDYHCSVFAATNNPSALGLDLSDDEVFPIRMSIDAADDKNLEAVVRYYLEDVLDGDIDYSEIIKELRNQEHLQGGRYTNAQFVWFCENLILKYGVDKISQEQLIDFIKEDKTVARPMLSDEKLKHFESEYEKTMGQRYEE